MGQFISVDGLYGYHTTPSAAIKPAGTFTGFGNILPVYYSPYPDSTRQPFNGGFNLALLSNLEMGMVVSTMTADGDNFYVPRISFKYQFDQFTKDSPLLSIGTTDLLNRQNFVGNLFFVGATHFYPFGTKITFETGAIYQRYTKESPPKEIYTPIRAFLNGSLDNGSYAFVFENKISDLGLELSQFLVYRPGFEEYPYSGFSVMVGRASTEFYPDKMSSIVAGFEYTRSFRSIDPDLDRIKKRMKFKEPIFWIDLKPDFIGINQLNLSGGLKQITAQRLGIESDIAIETGIPNLMWVNTFNFPIQSKNEEHLDGVTYWSKRVLQYEIPTSKSGQYLSIYAPQVSFGYFGHNARGILWGQKIALFNWRPIEFSLGIINQEELPSNPFMLYRVARLPIHPPFSGFSARDVQWYIEGGTFKDKSTTVGIVGNYPGGDGFEAEVSLRYNLDWGIEVGLQYTMDLSDMVQYTGSLMHIGLSPRNRMNFRNSISQTRSAQNESLDTYTWRSSINDDNTFQDTWWEKPHINVNRSIDTSYFNRLVFCRDTPTTECEVTDRDGDSIPDHLDACPDRAEDKDSFLDDDGCPDLDDDGDNITDSLDQCKMIPEDIDGYLDQDGCPEFDNDEDGILDSLDVCPLQAEDIDGFEDEDGCPELDNDGDGILDNFDRCVSIPEDLDGIDDDDGCPEFVDNDEIPDHLDNCPELTEDFDGFEDEDGCPEPDNDRDGIIDIKDQCPNKHEIFNSFMDEDGCPE